MGRDALHVHLLLGHLVLSPDPFLDELEGPLVLGDHEQLPGPPLMRGEATRFPVCVPHEPGVFGEVPAAAAACLSLLMSLAAL